ncbi:response regulator [Oceanirhabdus sp. W0125-5]|uniref:response regulator n=1 Tax=Oceanirhabdus sp. W0125-5 TaxID=2999116 RepID=UPI0022F31911|nr:response regulator [Oceanirhabdus sp. W0125-5]WBW97103.1 response regulator [Oceanirhabdus sp. W0125-5]
MIKVLIVEDDPMVSMINERFLKKVEGFELCGTVNSLEKAKESVKICKPDLILLDIFFPQGKGTDLLRWIRTENIKCDVILITADRNTDTVEEAFRYGVVDYLVKPFVFKRFKESLIQFKNRKCSFEDNDSIEQETIDKYILKDKNIELENIDDISDIKGFNQRTYEKVLDGIHDMGDNNFTAQQIAENIGVSRITARRYLDYLEKEKKLEVEMEYGKVGRPKNKYKLRTEE